MSPGQETEHISWMTASIPCLSH